MKPYEVACKFSLLTYGVLTQALKFPVTLSHALGIGRWVEPMGYSIIRVNLGVQSYN